MGMAAHKVISIFTLFAIFVNTANSACFARASCVPFFGKQQPTKSEEIIRQRRDYQAKDENTIADEHINNWKKQDFEMLKKLGEGQYGKVWKAVNIEDKNIYAVKQIRKGIFRKNATEALIRNEIELQRKLNSKFVVRLYNAFKDSAAYYLQLELVDGGELFDLMHSYGKFSEDTARFYAAEILCALKYIHDNDIVFRDLKPENILLTSEGHIKIADFGFAKEIGNDDISDSIGGSPGYIAPEILRRQPYNKAVDVWSLGVIIYAMIAGYNPFDGKSMLQTMRNLLDKNIIYDRKYFSSLSEGLLEHLLDRDSKQRYNLFRISTHHWFHVKGKIDWSKVKNQKYEPPFRPQDNGYIETNTQKFITKQK